MHFNQDFIAELKAQAAKQAKLHEHRVLPQQLDAVTSFIGRYPWQVILGASVLSATFIEILQL